MPGWISDSYGSVTVICLILLPFFNGNSIVAILCLCHEDKKIMGGCKWMDEGRERNSLVWSS